LYALVSLLDDRHYRQMEDLWRELDVDCGLLGVSLTPLPHFTWNLAAEYDFKALEPRLTQLATAQEPFTVRTNGLGFFTGPSPVIYLPLVKDAALARFHQRVWDLSADLAVGASPHYAPEAWVPHITVAYYDVEPAKLRCAVEKLAFRRYQWEVEVNNLSLVFQLSGQVGRLQQKFEFGETL
jgi:2'-5' RNA ligase